MSIFCRHKWIWTGIGRCDVYQWSYEDGFYECYAYADIFCCKCLKQKTIKGKTFELGGVYYRGKPLSTHDENMVKRHKVFLFNKITKKYNPTNNK